jgi:hypothetical protein
MEAWLASIESSSLKARLKEKQEGVVKSVVKEIKSEPDDTITDEYVLDIVKATTVNKIMDHNEIKRAMRQPGMHHITNNIACRWFSYAKTFQVCFWKMNERLNQSKDSDALYDNQEGSILIYYTDLHFYRWYTLNEFKMILNNLWWKYKVRTNMVMNSTNPDVGVRQLHCFKMFAPQHIVYSNQPIKMIFMCINDVKYIKMIIKSTEEYFHNKCSYIKSREAFIQITVDGKIYNTSDDMVDVFETFRKHVGTQLDIDITCIIKPLQDNQCCYTYHDSIADVRISKDIRYRRIYLNVAYILKAYDLKEFNYYWSVFQHNLLNEDSMRVDKFHRRYHYDVHLTKTTKNYRISQYEKNAIEMSPNDKTRWKTVQLIMDFLIESNIPYKKEDSFMWCIYRGQLRFDLRLIGYNIIIECDGDQHFKGIPFFDGNEEETAVFRQAKDVFKMLKANTRGYSFIRLAQVDVYNDKSFDWKKLLVESIHKLMKIEVPMNIILHKNRMKEYNYIYNYNSEYERILSTNEGIRANRLEDMLMMHWRRHHLIYVPICFLEVSKHSLRDMFSKNQMTILTERVDEPIQYVFPKTYQPTIRIDTS